MNDSTHQFCISAELADAQARLSALRDGVPTRERSCNTNVPSVNTLDLMGKLPAHLGWHSHIVTKTIRKTPPAKETPLIIEEATPLPPTLHEKKAIVPDTVALYPDLAMKILQDGSVATARIWLLLRHLDKMGRGCVAESMARSYLSETGSNVRVCGWRQLRKLLASGDGVFWERRDGNVWLRSPIKVAKHFDVARLTLRAVELPIELLCETIGKVRAHFYASFHSSRVQDKGSAPISRETLSTLTELSRPTQRTYEKIAGISCQINICISEISTPARKQQLTSEHGHAVFEFTDHRGKMGKSGTTYLAWQLPNSYGGCHALLAKGHQKRLNRQLADLFGIGMTGNGEDRQGRAAKRFFNDGAMASRRATGAESYWRSGTDSKKMAVWHSMVG